MPSTEPLGRRQCIPIIYTKGTHYEVGFDVGRTFGALIKSFLSSCRDLHDEFLPAYHTKEGRKAYEDTLSSVKANFPQYIREIEGTANGAGVPFHELFLLHLDRVITCAVGNDSKDAPAVGCSSICINEPGQEILGHTEDAVSETLNHFYFVSAHIISDKPEGRWGVKEEKFTSLCYAGSLPGYTMSYNHHGLVFSINTLSPTNTIPGKTPRYFITRALLAASTFEEAQKIIRDPGCGCADGCSINMTFLNQEGDRLFHNAEMGPATEDKLSQVNILTVSPGEYSMHCNSYLRLHVDELQENMKRSSIARLTTLKKYPVPKSKEDVIQMLGDTSKKEYNVFQESGPCDFVKTIAVGIFDCIERTWSIYSDNPRFNDPIAVLPLVLKNKAK